MDVADEEDEEDAEGPVEGRTRRMEQVACRLVIRVTLPSTTESGSGKRRCGARGVSTLACSAAAPPLTLLPLPCLLALLLLFEGAGLR